MSLSRCLAMPNVKARMALARHHQQSRRYSGIAIPIIPDTPREKPDDAKVEEKKQQQPKVDRSAGIKIGGGRDTSSGVSIAGALSTQAATQRISRSGDGSNAATAPRTPLRSSDFAKAVSQPRLLPRRAPNRVSSSDANSVISTYRQCADKVDAMGMYAAWEKIGPAGRSRLSSVGDLRAAREAWQALTGIGRDVSPERMSTLALSDAESKALQHMALGRAAKLDEFLHVWLRMLLRAGESRAVLECIDAYAKAKAGSIMRSNSIDWKLAEYLSLGLIAACAETEEATRKGALGRLFTLARRQPHPLHRALPAKRIAEKLVSLQTALPLARPQQLIAAVEQATEMLSILDVMWGLEAVQVEGAEAELEDAFGHYDFAQGAPTALPATRNSLARRLGFLASRRNADAMFSLIARCEQAITQGWIKVDLNSEARDVWNDTTSSIALASLLVVGRREDAARIWSLHCSWLPASAKGRPSTKVWGGLLDGYSHSRAHDSVRSTWAAMQPSERNSHAATTVVSFLLKEELLDEGSKAFDEAVAAGIASIHTYNAAMHGFAIGGQFEKATELLERMLAKGPKPNTATINIMLRYHARCGDMAELAKTLRSMETMALQPDIVTFTTLLDGLLRASAPSPAETVIKLMGESGIEANTVTYTALVKGLLAPSGNTAEQLDEPRITESIGLLAHMEEHGPLPSSVTYAAIASAVVRNPRAVELSKLPEPFNFPRPAYRDNEEPMELRDAPHLALSLTLFDRLYQRGISRTRPAMHTLLTTLVSGAGIVPRATEDILFARALRVLSEMCADTARVPKERTWQIVVQPFLDRAQDGGRENEEQLRTVLRLYQKWATEETPGRHSLGKALTRARELLRERQNHRTTR